MNLLHHLVVAEKVRDTLGWSRSLRGQMLLGAIAPDAHSEVPGIGRSALHPRRGEDAVTFILKLTDRGRCPADASGRAFAVSAIAHVVADELTRRHDYHLPPHAPTGFQPIEGDALDGHFVIDIRAITRSLMRAPSECSLGALSATAIDRKRWEVLGRWPLTEGHGSYLVVEPLAGLARHCANEALMRMFRSAAGAALLGSWRA
ncbi:MAG: hypothetical protein ACLFU7_01210 [Armatimonadota bacterium]